MLKMTNNYKYQAINKIIFSVVSGEIMGIFLLYSFSVFSKFIQVEYKCKFL